MCCAKMASTMCYQNNVLCNHKRAPYYLKPSLAAETSKRIMHRLVIKDIMLNLRILSKYQLKNIYNSF